MKFEFTGEKDLQNALGGLAERIKDPRPLLDLIGQLGARACRRNIDRQASPDGDPFAPTRRGGTILRDRSTLYGGITYALEGLRAVSIGAGAVTQAYNAYQHFGSQQWNDGETWEKGPKKGRRKGNPPRPFVGVSPEDLDEIMDEAADFIVAGA